MHENYLIRLRVSSSFLSYTNKIKLDQTKFLNQNKKENNRNYIQNKSEIISLSELIRRRKRRKISKKKKQQISQLFRITASIADLLPSLKIEEISHKEDTS